MFPENPADTAIKLGLLPYHARRAEAERAAGRQQPGVGRGDRPDRAGPRPVPGHGHRARERPTRPASRTQWRRLIEDDPWRAARDRELQAGLQGAGLDQRQHPRRRVRGPRRVDAPHRGAGHRHRPRRPPTCSRRTRLYFTVTNNPDGRVAGTRRQRQRLRHQPRLRHVVAARGAGDARRRDRHPAAGDARRARLRRHHADRAEHRRRTARTTTTTCTSSTRYPNALGMEQAIQALGHPETARAPTSRSATTRPATGTTGRRSSPRCTRCTTARSGTPSRCRCGSTAATYDTLPVEELRRRSRDQRRRRRGDHPGARSTTPTPTATQLIADQIELFRRGWAGEAQRQIPDGFVPGFGPEDRYTHHVPARVRDPGRHRPALRRRRRPGSSTT